jgi:ribosomal protein S18 acetylase RimI-like enzyme
MSDPFEIRRLQAVDAEDYRAIRLAALKTQPQAFGAVHADEASRPAAHFAERIATSTVLGAYHQAQIVGMIWLKQEVGAKVSHKGLIWGFYVEPFHQRRGIGSALLATIIDAARDLVEQVTLTVVQQNTFAIALYERFGFSVYGVEPRALRTSQGFSDEVLMVRILD